MDKVKRTSFLASVIFFFCLISSNGLAQSDSDAVASLKGLKGVFVLVEELGSYLENDGLNRDQIKTDVELKLRMAGIKVLTQAECFKLPGTPYLYINIASVGAKEPFPHTFAYNAEVSLYQQGRFFYISRPIPAATWNKEKIAMVGRFNVQNAIRTTVKDLMDGFINDYLSVNPKGGN